MEQSAWRVIVSRASGGGKALSDWPRISLLLREHGVEFSEKITDHSYHAIELAIESLKEGFRKFIVIGGDGAIHEVVNGLCSQDEVDIKDVTLAIVPVGSGNDWARLHKIPSDYEGAVEVIAHAERKTRVQDIARIGTMMDGKPYCRYMVNIGGLGFDSLVSQKYDVAKSRGHASDSGYYKALMTGFILYKCLKFEISVDGRPFYEGRALSVALGIGKYCGGGMMQTPGAVFDDGLIDITVVKDVGKFKFLLNVPRLFKGTIYEIKNKVIFTRGRHIEIKASPYSYMEVDGEPVGITPVSVDVIPGAVKVVSNL